MVGIWVVYPDGYDAAKPIPTLLTFPPGGQDLVMVDYSFNWWVQVALERGWLVIGAAAPLGRHFPWDGRAVLGPLIDALLARFPVESGKFHLAGIHTGGTSALAAALDHPGKFRSLTMIGGTAPLPEDTANVARLRSIPITIYTGEFDEGRRTVTAVRDALTRAGIPLHFEVVPGVRDEHNQLKGDAAAPLFDRMLAP